MRKPFDILAEGLSSENSRGDKTAIELFIAGVRGWEAGWQRRMDGRKMQYGAMIISDDRGELRHEA
jgi:hypothetical protein